MFELFVGLVLQTSVQLYDSLNDRVVYIKTEQEKVYLIKKEKK